MKKLLLVFAIGAFAACNNTSTTEAKAGDSSATKPADSTKMVADSSKKATDSSAKPADSTKKDSTTKK